MSLQETEAASAAVVTHPRVRLQDIEGAIAGRYDVMANDAVCEAARIGADGKPTNPLALLSICILVMRNGFTVIGKSAPASPENFNAELGRKFAYEDAVRQLWPLMGFSLRDKLSQSV